MFKILTLSFCMISATAFAGTPGDLQPVRSDGTVLLAMGPDPGGHTGAGVTPETTKTDSPAVDQARKSTSGAGVESNSPGNPATPKQASAPAKPAN